MWPPPASIIPAPRPADVEGALEVDVDHAIEGGGLGFGHRCRVPDAGGVDGYVKSPHLRCCAGDRLIDRCRIAHVRDHDEGVSAGSADLVGHPARISLVEQRDVSPFAGETHRNGTAMPEAAPVTNAVHPSSLTATSITVAMPGAAADVHSRRHTGHRPSGNMDGYPHRAYHAVVGAVDKFHEPDCVRARLGGMERC